MQGSRIRADAGDYARARADARRQSRAGASMNKQFAGSGELIAATLRGYRCWGITTKAMAEGGSSLRLKAVSAGTLWPAREQIVAECDKCSATIMNGIHIDDEHKVPCAHCTCGIYGWYEPESALIQHSQCVMGVVECSGTILLGSTGFRAQKAKIVALCRGNESHIYPHTDLQPNRTRDLLPGGYAKYVHYVGGVVMVNYGEIQAALNDYATERIGTFERQLHTLGEIYEVPVCRNLEDLKKKYPPQLDTLENVLEGKLQRYAR